MDNTNKGNSRMITAALSLIKRNIIGAFEVITQKNIFKVQIEDDEKVYSYLNKVNERLDRVIQGIKELPSIKMGDSPASISIQTMGKDTIEKIAHSLDGIQSAVHSSRAIFPKTQQVTGTVRVENQKEFPLGQLLLSLQSINNSIRRLKLEVPAPQVSNFKPTDPILFPKSFSIAEGQAILASLDKVSQSVENLPRRIPTTEFPTSVRVSNFPPAKYPLPATHMTINPLQGFSKSTAVTVTTTAKALPSTALAYRRTLIFFNNSSTTSLYFGGSDVTTSNGTPVLPQTSSPAIDAGGKNIVYGITTGTADVRVFEISDESYTRGTPNV